jgi:hypothetical protein
MLKAEGFLKEQELILERNNKELELTRSAMQTTLRKMEDNK